MKMDDLSKPMQRAVIDLVCRGVLHHNRRSEWCGAHSHQERTIRALQRKRLLDIVPMPGGPAAYPTPAADQLVKNDCDETNAIIRAGGCG